MKERKKKEGALSYIKYSAMQQRIGEFGFSLSLKKYMFYLLIIAAACLVVGIVFKMKAAYIVLVEMIFLVCAPFLIILRFKFNYQQKKFAEVTLYLQQISYAFKRKNKILNSLIEVEKLTSGRINKLVNEAIDYIERGEAKENLHAEALQIIENAYKCSRIKTLHRFMLEVEEYGGEYRSTLSTLIQDIDTWITRTMTYQENRKNIQLKTTISIIMSLIICMIIPYILPDEITNVTELYESAQYQVMSLISLSSFLIFFLVVLGKTSSSWLDLEDIKKTYTIKDAQKDYATITEYDVDKHTVKHVIMACIFGVGFVTAFAITRNILFIVIYLVLAILIVLNPRMYVKKAKKRLLQDLTISFPNWIRSMVLHLQTNNLQVALRKSLDDCDGALKIEVLRLIENIDKDPVGQQPYFLFMEHFDAYKIKSILRALYGISEYGKKEVVEQINAIIRQNDGVSATAEKLADDLKISGMQFYVLMPMLLGSINMFVNLFIFGSSFFTFFNTTGMF